MRFTRLGRTALYCYSVIMVTIGSFPFIEWEEMMVEGALKKLRKKLNQTYTEFWESFAQAPSTLFYLIS